MLFTLPIKKRWPKPTIIFSAHRSGRRIVPLKAKNSPNSTICDKWAYKESQKHMCKHSKNPITMLKLKINYQPRIIVSRRVFSFSKVIRSGKHTRTSVSGAEDILGGTYPIPSYLNFCHKNLEFSKMSVCKKLSISMLLSSFRFHVVGSFEFYSAVVKTIKTESNLAPKAVVKKNHNLWVLSSTNTMLKPSL